MKVANNSQVPPVTGGQAVFDTGKKESTDKHGQGRWTEDPNKVDSKNL